MVGCQIQRNGDESIRCENVMYTVVSRSSSYLAANDSEHVASNPDHSHIVTPRVQEPTRPNAMPVVK